MAIKISGKPINLTCTEREFPEFPTLLFGTLTERSSYFDASSYLQQNHPELSVQDFFTHFECPIQKVLASNDLSSEECFVTNQDGHILIDGTLCYLFLSYVEQDFLAYVYDRIHEVFANGFAVSDTYLLHHASRRLSKEALNMMDNENNQ